MVVIRKVYLGADTVAKVIVLVVMIQMVRLEVSQVGKLGHRVVHIIVTQVVDSVAKYPPSKERISHMCGKNSMEERIEATNHKDGQGWREHQAHPSRGKSKKRKRQSKIIIIIKLVNHS